MLLGDVPIICAQEVFTADSSRGSSYEDTKHELIVGNQHLAVDRNKFCRNVYVLYFNNCLKPIGEQNRPEESEI